MIDFNRHDTDCGILVVRVAGKLEGESNQYFFDCIQDEIASGRHHIVINFSDVGYISSAGLGSLVRARSRVSKSGGLIYLSRIENNLVDIFSLVNFDKVFKIFPTETEAVDAMRQHLPKVY